MPPSVRLQPLLSFSIDAVWPSRKQRRRNAPVRRRRSQLDAQPLSMTANCRSSACLISADSPCQAAADDWLTLYTLNAGPEMTNASSRRTTNPDGSVNLRIYGQARQ